MQWVPAFFPGSSVAGACEVDQSSPFGGKVKEFSYTSASPVCPMV